jgi:NAD+ synthase
MKDAEAIVMWNGVGEQSATFDIQPSVDELATRLAVDTPLRRGNLMARVRMLAVFDTAKKLGALVCGTENKSEHYLGYFTRFGDAASDVEPLSTLYKTQVWAMAKELGLPEIFYTKAPSAGLWEGQSDEDELGFSYSAADAVLKLLVDEGKPEAEVVELLEPEWGTATVQRVLDVVAANAFKREVPYVFSV